MNKKTYLNDVQPILIEMIIQEFSANTFYINNKLAIINFLNNKFNISKQTLYKMFASSQVLSFNFIFGLSLLGFSFSFRKNKLPVISLNNKFINDIYSNTPKDKDILDKFYKHHQNLPIYSKIDQSDSCLLIENIENIYKLYEKKKLNICSDLFKILFEGYDNFNSLKSYKNQISFIKYQSLKKSKSTLNLYEIFTLINNIPSNDEINFNFRTNVQIKNFNSETLNDLLQISKNNNLSRILISNPMCIEITGNESDQIENIINVYPLLSIN